MRREIAAAAAVVFVASFCTLVIELVAGRILAPYVGVSLYTWTSVIGVVLAGISVGAWVGGALADRYSPATLLPTLLFLSGAAAFAIVPLTNLAGKGVLLWPQASLMARVVALATIIFFAPSCVLGMISPVAVKLALRDLQRTGHIVGRIYAVSAVGSIVGTFATGFVLIARFGTRAILIGVAVALTVCAVISAASYGRRKLLLATALPIGFGWAIATARSDLLKGPFQNDKFYEETSYYTIRIEERTRIDGAGKLQTLILDQLIHSLNDVNRPCYLAYGYLRIFDELLRSKARGGRPLDVLFLGGGGYTLPRCAERALPAANIDVVEIDPRVTAACYRFLGLSPHTRIRTVNSDARWHLIRSPRKYDVIFGDAFNDLSIPYHLTTREFVQLQKMHLKPRGILAANVIDNVPSGDFLPSYLRTVQGVFGPATSVLVDRDSYARGSQSTLVIVAGALEDLPPLAQSMPLPARDLQDALRRRRWTCLTDDHAPVDNLLAPLFAERARYRR